MTNRHVWMGILAAMAAGMAPGAVATARAQTAPPTASAAARPYVDAARGQTVDELVALALRQSPDASAVRARVPMARGEFDQAGNRPNPSLSFEQREQAGGSDRQTSIGLAWPLDLSRREGRTTVAQRSVDVASAEVADRERRLATEVRSLAARLLGAVRQLQVREDVAEANRKTVELIAARVDIGAAPAVDRDVARIEAQMAEVEVHRMRSEVEAAAAGLRSAVGMEPAAPLLLRQSLDELVLGTVPAAGPAALTAERVQQALAVRPDFRRDDAAIARELARQDQYQREGGWDLSLTAGYMRTAAGFPQFGLTQTGAVEPIGDTFHMVAFGAMVMLPWQNRNQGAIAAAQAAADGARHEREARRLSAMNEIEALRRREAEAQRALDVFGGGLRTLATRNLDVQRESYQLGRATLLDVLTEQRRYLGVETAYASALLELALARVALAGELGDAR